VILTRMARARPRVEALKDRQTHLPQGMRPGGPVTLQRCQCPTARRRRRSQSRWPLRLGATMTGPVTAQRRRPSIQAFRRPGAAPDSTGRKVQPRTTRTRDGTVTVVRVGSPAGLPPAARPGGHRRRCS
jgi:hypothetical protein